MIRAELGPTLRLSIPVILAELGWMTMGVVDTIMVGPLGPAAIGATGVGNSLHMAFAIFGMGILLGLDTLVSQAYGARDLEACHRWLYHGVRLALITTVPLLAILLAVSRALPFLGFHPEVMPLLHGYFSVMLWSTPFLLLYASCRRYLQGMHFVAPVTFALVSANLVNALGNWVLIYGRFGFPALGVSGSAWATLTARAYMFGVLAVVIWWTNRQAVADRSFARPLAQAATTTVEGVTVASGVSPLRLLVRLGLPAAATITAEVGVFALATAMAGSLEPIATAAHQIALNIASVAFMIPLGLASAGAVRVGRAVGAGDRRGAAAAGWTAIALGTAFMVVSGSMFVLAPRFLIGAFTTDPSVIALASSLLLIGALFQLFDGVQGVTTGTMRGLGDTRTPMVANLAAHWLVGLPISYTLCFTLGWGVRGLWWGLSVGLILVSVVLIAKWTRTVKRYQETGSL